MSAIDVYRPIQPSVMTTQLHMAAFKTNRFLRNSAQAENLSVVIDGTTHMNFSDMNFTPRLMSRAVYHNILHQKGRRFVFSDSRVISFSINF